jgi:hypothetical protein
MTLAEIGAKIANRWNSLPQSLQSWIAALEAFVWIAIVSAVLEYPFSDLNHEHGIRTFIAKVGLTALAATRVYVQKHPFRKVLAEIVSKPDGTIQEVVYDQGKTAVDTGSNGQDEGKGNVGEVRQSDEEEDRSGKEGGRPA